MDIFIYFHGPLPEGRDVFEDAIEQSLTGIGTVTGGGSGQNGSNIDLRIFDPLTDVSELLLQLKEVLRKLQAPGGTVIQIGGKRFPLDS